LQFLQTITSRLEKLRTNPIISKRGKKEEIEKGKREQRDNTTREISTSSHPAQTLVLTSLFDRTTIMNLVKFFSAHIIGNVAASNKIMNFQLDTPNMGMEVAVRALHVHQIIINYITV
jgi:hypothetical protein